MPVPNLAAAVAFFSHDVTIRETPTGVTVDADGRRTFGASADRTIRAHCFHTPQQTIARLDLGHEPGGSLEIHTTERLALADPGTERRSTVVVWDGREWEVDTAGPRTAGAGTHSFGVYFAKLIRRATTL